MEPGTIHIISELGGCEVGLPPDTEEITNSLRNYARCQCMEALELVDPPTDDLGEWTDMWTFAVSEYEIEGPVLVGMHQADRVLLAVSKHYGYPGPEAPLDDTVTVVRLPK